MAKARLKAKASDPIDLTHLPTDKIANKARRILDAISQGECYTTFKGKRMRYNRSIISVPVNRDYRIIYDATDGGIKPRTVLSHEDYNATKPAELH